MFDVVCGFLYDLAVMETMIDVDEESTDDVVAVKASIVDEFDVGFHVFGEATIEEGGLEVFGFQGVVGQGLLAVVAVVKRHCSRKFCEALDERVFEGSSSSHCNVCF